VGEHPTQSKSSPLKLLVLGCGLLVVLVALCGGGFALFMAQGKAKIDPVAEAFVQKLNAKDYSGAYASIGPEWKKIQEPAKFEEFLTLIHDVMGSCQSKSVTSMNFKSLGSGSTAQVVYSAKFTNGSGTIRASFTNSSGPWKVVGWRVESPLFKQALTCPKCNQTSKNLAKFCPSCGAPLVGKDATGAAEKPDSKTPEGQ
jgi:ssDNA-binding Zn-finger/Zn-ribbon topoisomerase 1